MRAEHCSVSRRQTGLEVRVPRPGIEQFSQRNVTEVLSGIVRNGQNNNHQDGHRVHRAMNRWKNCASGQGGPLGLVESILVISNAPTPIAEGQDSSLHESSLHTGRDID